MNDTESYTGTKLSDFQRGYMKAIYDLEEPVKNVA